MNPEVIVVGDLMVDVVATVDGPVAIGSDTPATIVRRGGGSAANTAAWLASVGTPTALVAGVGDDEQGRWALDELRRAGVEHLGPVVAGVPTGACLVLVDERRERTMFPDRGANAHLGRFDPADLARWAPARVHLSAYALLDPASRDMALGCIGWCVDVGVPVSVDAASAAPIRDVGAELVLGWLRGVDELLANDDEVDALGGVERILGSVGALVHKRGADGASWVTTSRTESIPAATVEAVDTTGAGDAFAAGWMASGIAGLDVIGRLEEAVTVAGRAVSAVGGRPEEHRP